MNQSFQKSCYDDHPGFHLHHTSGTCAKDSTLPYTHYNIHFMLIYFLHGTGSIKIEGKHYEIKEGDIILLNPTELFCCTVDANSYHERLVLYVSETIFHNFPYECNNLFMSFYQRKKGIGNHIPSQVVKKHNLDSQLVNLLHLVKAPDTTSCILSICKVIELLAHLNRIVMPLYINTLYNSERTNDHPLINNILSYINVHFKEDIDISTIAAQFNIDRSHLAHLFKDQVGMSLWNYVILRRIYLFNELIRIDHSIEETCYRAGFQNYSNFFRLYKKYMNMTPLQFKKKIQNTKNDPSALLKSDVT